MNISYTRNNGQFAIRLNTVNVIEMANGEMQGVRSFVDNPEGNKRAEDLFKRLVKENQQEPGLHPRLIEEDYDDLIEEGLYENGTYQLFLTHSV